MDRYAQYTAIIKDELNIKQCIWTNDFSAYETIHYKLNFKTAGVAFGQHVNKVKDYVLNLNADEKKSLQRDGAVKLNIEGLEITLLPVHVVNESMVKEHYILAEDTSCRVLLNTHLTEDLLQEGQIRELIRSIQDTRKKMGITC